MRREGGPGLIDPHRFPQRLLSVPIFISHDGGQNFAGKAGRTPCPGARWKSTRTTVPAGRNRSSFRRTSFIEPADVRAIEAVGGVAEIPDADDLVLKPL
ncbi:hypothetical protein MesoLjLc_61970 [Mesorhizobium sp. L-8-10]|nr:hypothetical protein MesoLjLc_61970 [Mesorhizobium sp. L-8-10]